ncbi:hypothetical protein PMAYCL1PPCAC_03208, partial [Pristionchus mayeri]
VKFRMFPSDNYENMLSTPTYDNFTSFDSQSSLWNTPGDVVHSVGDSWQGLSPVELIPNDPCDNQCVATSVSESSATEFTTESDSRKRGRRRKDQRKHVSQCTDRCRICGDESTGHHYDIPSCNGCKSFFRRTLLDQRRFVCEREGKCPVLPKTRKEQKRRHCRACRFRRCVEVGMNPMGIVVEEEEDREALQLALKRPALLLNDVSIIIEFEFPPLLKAISQRLVSIDEHMNHIVDNLMFLEFKHQLLRRSDLNPNPSDRQSILDILRRHTAMGQPQKEMAGWPLTQGATRAVMSLEEHAQLRIPLPRLCANGLPPSFKFWFYVDLVYAIEWAKTLDFFRVLDPADQQELICFSAWQILNITHSYFSYSRGSDKAVFPDGKFSVWTPREADRDVINPFFRLKIDKTEYILLKALILCNPSCETISDRTRSILQKKREKLSKVLLNHCLRTGGRVSGAARFGEIISLEGVMLNQALKTKNLQSLLSVLNLRPMRINIMDEICGIHYDS